VQNFLKSGPKTKTQIYSDLFQRHRASADINRDLKALIGEGKIRQKAVGKAIYFASVGAEYDSSQ
jgi:hypothetical protein